MCWLNSVIDGRGNGMENVTNILEYLENSARRFPDKPAYTDVTDEYTSSQLQQAARSIGTALCGSVEKGSPVAVYMEKSVHQIAAFFGAVYAGAFYSPIDVDLPSLRVKLILDTLQTQTVISDRESVGKLHAMGFTGRIFLFDEIAGTAADDDRLAAIRQKAADTDPLYAIFTSGSTGTPKGVLISPIRDRFHPGLCGNFRFFRKGCFWKSGSL